MVKESKYSERQSDFKQISVIGACMTFAYWITWTSSRWNDVWGWVKNCVNRNEFISSDQRYSFQKNLDIPLYSAPTGYIRRKIIQNGALLTTIQILATFWDQNFQVFIWRDLEENILGNRLLGLLNIVPARNWAISSYFSCSENWFLCEFAKWYFAILELWLSRLYWAVFFLRALFLGQISIEKSKYISNSHLHFHLNSRQNCSTHFQFL